MYLEQTVADMTEVPGVIAAFAQSIGWDVAGNSLARPGGGRRFTLESTAKDAANPALTVRAAGGAANDFVQVRSPRIGTGMTTYVSPIISKVHLFGSAAPYGDGEPFIAVVLEFGFNSYRHVYIGNMVKLGDYQGGEVISGNNFVELFVINTRGNNSFASNNNQYLFSAHHEKALNQGVGGVYVDHPDSSTLFRRFSGTYYASSSSLSLLGPGTVIGGWQDNVNTGLATRGVMTYAAGAILTPVNLYTPSGAFGADYRYRALGYVAGVRMVRMDAIEPGAEIEVGGRRWKVFPEFARDTRQTTPRDTPANPFNNFLYETSYMAGLAYALD